MFLILPASFYLGEVLKDNDEKFIYPFKCAFQKEQHSTFFLKLKYDLKFIWNSFNFPYLKNIHNSSKELEY